MSLLSKVPKVVAAAAAYYAEKLKWRVFPLYEMAAGGACSCSKGTECKTPGKHPRVSIPSGEKAVHPATTDLKTVSGWWKKWPNANIGLWLEDAAVIVLDIDKSDKKDGFQGLFEIETFSGEKLPLTLTCNTPSGGKHHYFKFTDGVPNKSNSLGPGLDTWHTAHYVILPPSNHVKGVYEWDPATSSVAEYPLWLKPKPRDMGGPGGSGGIVGAKNKAGRPAKEKIDPNDIDDVTRLVHALKHVDATDRDIWVKVGFALARAWDWADAGFVVYDDWSKVAHNYDPVKTKDQYYKQSRVMVGSPITCASIFEWARKHPDYQAWKKPDDRPYEIREYPADHPATLGEMAAVIDKYPIYQRGPKLVEILPINQNLPNDGSGDWRPKGSFVLREIGTGQFASRILPTQARWMKKGQFGWRATSVHQGLAETFLGVGNWPTAMKLRAFVQHPTLRDDGSLLTVRGYDERSGLFLTTEIPVIVKDKPTKKDAERAIKELLHPFHEFKWIDGAVSMSALMAAIMTVGLRHLFDEAVPLFAIDAPRQGSGKTKLVKAISNLWFGLPMATTPYSTEPEEMKKHLASMLLAGDRVVLFDNVPGTTKVNDPTLNALLTSGRATFRELGTQRMLELDSATTFFMTGNKLKIVGDMIRRTIKMQIDPEGLHPTERKFKIDPLEEYVLKHRVKLMSAALTCAKAFFAAGCPTPKGVMAIASFEAWSVKIRNMLLWLGLDDVKETISQGYEEDDESMEIEHLIRELAKIDDLCGSGLTSAMMLPFLVDNQTLTDAMMPFYNSRNGYQGISHPRIITTILSQVAKIAVDGKRLLRIGPLWVIRERDDYLRNQGSKGAKQ